MSSGSDKAKRRKSTPVPSKRSTLNTDKGGKLKCQYGIIDEVMILSV